jgi:hypothetical protein
MEVTPCASSPSCHTSPWPVARFAAYRQGMYASSTVKGQAYAASPAATAPAAAGHAQRQPDLNRDRASRRAAAAAEEEPAVAAARRA